MMPRVRTQRTARWPLLVCAVTTISLMVTACTSSEVIDSVTEPLVSDQGISADEESAESGSDDTTDPIDEQDLSAEDLVIPDDIDAELVLNYAGLDLSWESIQSQLAEEEDLHHQREDATFECMREAGFQYIRQPYENLYAPVYSGDYGEIGSRAWRQWYGFGVSTLYWPQELLPEDVAGDPNGFVLESSQEFESDLSNLTQAEAQAYSRALYGDEQSDGCSAQAWEQSTSDFEIALRTWPELLSEIQTRVMAHETVVDYQTGLVECVHEQGFSEFAGPAAYMDDLQSQLWALLGESDPEAALPDDVVDALRLIQDRERDVAIALFDCQLPQDEELALFRSAVEDVLGR